MLYLATTPTPPTPPAPPAAQGGYAPWYATTDPVELDLLDNTDIGVGISTHGTYFAPVSLSISGLPAYTFVAFLSSSTSTATLFWIYTSLQTPPGSYTLTLTAVGGLATTVTTFTLIVSSDLAPPAPAALTRTTGRLYGVVRKNSPHGPQLRRYSLPVNPNTVRMSRWRHVFGTTKQLWRSMGPNGANNAPTNGVDPQTAWIAQNMTYSAPRIPGAIVDGVQAMAIPGPLATGEAYMVMVQTTMANLGRAPLPTPSATVISAAAFGVTTTGSAGAWNGNIPKVQTNPQNPLFFTMTLDVIASGNQFANPPSPTGTGGYSFNPIYASVTVEQGGTVQIYAQQTGSNVFSTSDPLTISGLPSGMTAALSWNTAAIDAIANLTIGGSVTPGSYAITIKATHGSSNATWSTTVVVYSAASNPFTVTLSSLTAGFTAVKTPPRLTPLCPTLSGNTSGAGTITFTLAPGSSLASTAVTLTLGTPAGSITLTFALAVQPCNLQAAAPSPQFLGYQGMTALVIYDSTYTVTGFLIYVLQQDGTTTGMVVNGVDAVPQFQLAASDRYASNAKKPTGSDISPISYDWPDIDSAADTLAIWEAAYGPLPNDGGIVWQITPFDPTSGAVGAALTATTKWENGTLKGFSRADWLGPIFTCSTLTGIVIQAAGTTTTYNGLIVGASSQAGWGGGAGIPYGGTITFTAYQTGKYPGTVEAIAVFPTVTVPSGDTTPIPFTFTLQQDATNPDPAVAWTIVATDGISSVSMKFQLNTH